MKRLLVTGASGFLGWNICGMSPGEWTVFGVCRSHRVEIPGVHMLNADLKRFGEVQTVFREARPDAVIHAAALSRPDLCQLHPVESRRINVDASVSIAGLCADLSIPCLFTSSDLVFDGRNAPYREEDPVSPVNLYGEHKVMAEEGMLKTYPEAVICRMSLMFGEAGPAGESFIQPMIRSMKGGGKIFLFTDEYRTPMSARTAVRGLFLALSGSSRILHLGGRERVSRYHFGLLLRDGLGLPGTSLIPRLQCDVATDAPRPPDVSLDSSRAMRVGFDPLRLMDEIALLRQTLRP